MLIWLIWFPLLLGPHLLSYDQQRGLTRVLFVLPVTAKQIGHAWWLSVVGVPALLLAATAGLSAIVPLKDGQTAFLFLNCLMQILLLGCFFCPWSPMGADGRSGWRGMGWGAFLRAISRLALIAGFLLLVYDFSWSNRFKAVLFVVAGTVLTVNGWFRAEQRVLQDDAFRPDAQAATSGSPQYKAPAGFGGLPFLWQSLIIHLGWLGLAFVGWLVLSGMYQGGSWRFPPQLVEADVIPFSLICFLGFYFFVVAPVVTQLRVLRTLPISASILAATLVLIPSGTIIFLVFVLAALGEGPVVLGSLLTAAAVTAFVPVVVWRGLGTATPIPASLLILVSIIIFPACFELASGPPLVAVSLSMIVIFLSWEITRRVLRSSSQAYRVDPFVMSNWGGARWS